MVTLNQVGKFKEFMTKYLNIIRCVFRHCPKQRKINNGYSELLVMMGEW
jgi:hypothetical protein